jgi:hypothetical protein
MMSDNSGDRTNADSQAVQGGNGESAVGHNSSETDTQMAETEEDSRWGQISGAAPSPDRRSVFSDNVNIPDILIIMF